MKALIRPYAHNKYFNWIAPIWFSVLIPGQEFLKAAGDVILSSNIIFNSLQALHR